MLNPRVLYIYIFACDPSYTLFLTRLIKGDAAVLLVGQYPNNLIVTVLPSCQSQTTITREFVGLGSDGCQVCLAVYLIGHCHTTDPLRLWLAQTYSPRRH